jgi:putative flippase GtrA
MKKLIKTLCGKIRHFIRLIYGKFEQFIKFGLVGVVNTIVGYGITYLFVWWSKDLYLVGYILGFVMGTLCSYFLNNRFVFGGKASLKGLMKSYGSYTFSLLLGMGILSFQVEVLHIDEYIAPAINLLITIPLNFILNKFWVFKPTHKN